MKKANYQERTVKITMSVNIETTRSVDDIKNRIIKGLGIWLNNQPYYITDPKNIKVNYCKALAIEQWIDNIK
jgi:hypothetical protein